MTNDFRLGEELWMEWDGKGFESEADLIYYTYTHVDTNNPVVQRALACALQRDGVVLSISDGFKVQDGSRTTRGYVGKDLEDETVECVCEQDGTTELGDSLESAVETTFIEITL